MVRPARCPSRPRRVIAARLVPAPGLAEDGVDVPDQAPGPDVADRAVRGGEAPVLQFLRWAPHPGSAAPGQAEEGAHRLGWHPATWTESGAWWQVGVPALSGHAELEAHRARQLRWLSASSAARA